MLRQVDVEAQSTRLEVSGILSFRVSTHTIFNQTVLTDIPVSFYDKLAPYKSKFCIPS